MGLGSQPGSLCAPKLINMVVFPEHQDSCMWEEVSLDALRAIAFVLRGLIKLGGRFLFKKEVESIQF